MKTSKLTRWSNSYSYLIIALLSFSVIFVACEKSLLEETAVEKTIVDVLQIKSTATLPLLIGKDSTLNIVLLPANASNAKLIWTSSNPSVATVDDKGKVTAIAAGESVITAVTSDGGVRKSTITVRAISKIDYITDIVITPGSASVFQGEAVNLIATLVPTNATYFTLKWKTSNPAIATVSETGVVTTLSKGTVTITAESTDGSKVAKSVNIEVKEVIPVTAVAINNVPSETMALGEVLALNLSLTPTNASIQALKWTSSNPSAVTVSQTGVLTAVGVGSATITVETKNGNGVNATANVTVEEGKINDTFTTTSVWRAATSGSTSIIEDNKFKVTMATGAKYRGDFQRTGGATVHAGKFPIIAFKFNRPLGTGNVIFDTSLGSYLNGNNKLTTITGKDGVQVHYADIAADSFGGTPTKLSTTATTVFTVFQLKIADFVLTPADLAAGGNKYEVHWVKSFKNLNELQAYIAK